MRLLLLFLSGCILLSGCGKKPPYPGYKRPFTHKQNSVAQIEPVRDFTDKREGSTAVLSWRAHETADHYALYRFDKEGFIPRKPFILINANQTKYVDTEVTDSTCYALRPVVGREKPLFGGLSIASR